MTTRSCASTIRLRRQFAIRNIRCGTPSRGVTVTLFANSTRADGRAKRVNVSPVISAMPRIPVIASVRTTMCAYRVTGYIPP